MGKFRYTSANVAKVANALINKGYPLANNLLKFANIESSRQVQNGTLAKVSNALAGQSSYKIRYFSGISKFSRGAGINSEKQIDGICKQADKQMSSFKLTQGHRA